MEKHTLHRTGAVALILGVLITGVGHFVHPDEPADLAGFLPMVAGSPHWAAIHWSLMIGLVLMQFGFAAFMLTLRDPAEKHDAGGWGLIGIYMLMVGLALWLGLFATEAALKPLADAARNDPASLAGARALAGLGDALQSAAIFVYWLGIALLGIALSVSLRYPRWMGAIGVLAGAVTSLAIGLPRAFMGPSAWTEQIGFPVAAVLSLVWALVLGGMLWRMAGPARKRARR